MADGTLHEREILKERITARLGERGLTARQVSLQATGKPDVIRDMLRRTSTPNGPTLARIADILGTTTDWLLGRAESPHQVHSEVTIADRRIDFRGYREPDLPGIPLLGTGDCADLELCDESGSLVQVERSTFDVDFTVRMIRRPPALAGNKDLYAIQFQGESMEPRFERGEIGLVDPRRPVGKGDYVLVQLRGEDHDDVESVLAKRLVRQTAKEYVLEQFNPPVVFTLPKARVKRIHRIMRQTDYLF